MRHLVINKPRQRSSLRAQAIALRLRRFCLNLAHCARFVMAYPGTTPLVCVSLPTATGLLTASVNLGDQKVLYQEHIFIYIYISFLPWDLLNVHPKQQCGIRV